MIEIEEPKCDFCGNEQVSYLQRVEILKPGKIFKSWVCVYPDKYCQREIDHSHDMEPEFKITKIKITKEEIDILVDKFEDVSDLFLGILKLYNEQEEPEDISCPS